MALGSHLITVRRLEKYINDVIGKKANLPDTSKTIIENISQINSDLSREYRTLTLSVGNGNIVFNRFGKLVIITIYWTGPVTRITDVIASVPLNARPYFDIRTPVYTALTNVVAAAFINTNGEIFIEANSQTTTEFSDFFSGQIVYMIQ